MDSSKLSKIELPSIQLTYSEHAPRQAGQGAT
jgi:hypothetical protein